MEKLTMIWGWMSPQYEVRNERFLLFFFSEKQTREVVRKDLETGEETTDTIEEWVCDAVEFSKEESKDVLRMLRENPNSLEFHKWMLKTRVEMYDSSKHVNSFTIGGMETWLDKATRVGLKLRFEAEIRMGKQQTTLWQDGISFPLPLVGETTAIDMLDGIELYASACYDVTQMHLAAVAKMDDVDAIKSYDYTFGYPEKLAF